MVNPAAEKPRRAYEKSGKLGLFSMHRLA